MLPKRLNRLWNFYLKLLVIVALVLALYFRLGNLAVKPYWADEVFTSLRVSGYSSGTVDRKIDGELVPIDALYQYQDVDSGRSWRNVIGALAGRPEHAPLYFVLARLWAQAFGSSVGAMRAMPALISLLALPLFYWVSRLLFHSSEIANVTLCFACVSPILIRQAQEARPYSLWIVGILASSALLFSALRSDKRSVWLLYSLSVAFAFLTHLLSTFIFVAHGLYVLILYRKKVEPAAALDTIRRPRSEIESPVLSVDRLRFLHFRRYLLSGMMLVLPWLLLVISRLALVHSSTSWQNQASSLKDLMVSWTQNTSYLVLFWFPPNRWPILAIFLSLLIAFALYRLVVRSHPSQWLLPVLFCALPGVLLVASDLLLGGIRSTVSRYLIPTYLGILLALGFGVGFNPCRLQSSLEKGYRWGRRILFHILLAMMVAASWHNLHSSVWWKTFELPLIRASQIVMRSPAPATVVSDKYIGDVLSLAYRLRPTDRILWFASEEIDADKIFNSVETFFLYKPSEQLLDKVEDGLEERQLMLTPTKANNLLRVVEATPQSSEAA